jgi:hypothetical protein
MSTVKVQQVLRRYHLKSSERDLQPRLNLLTETVLRDQLGSVLAESGIGSSELVCIKELHLKMYYDNNKSDFEISELWRKALLKSVYQQLGKSNRVDLIRYPSRIEAIKSVARSLTVGELNHQWAWQQLGITDGKSTQLHQVKDQWIAYLTIHPHLLIPVFKGLMTEGTFIKLLERNVLGSDELIQLSDIASKFLGLEIDWSGIIERQKELNEQALGSKKLSLLLIKKPPGDLIMALLRSYQSTSELNFLFAESKSAIHVQNEWKPALVKLLFWAVLEPGSNELNLTSSTKKTIEAKLLDIWQLLDTEQPSLSSRKNAEFISSDNLHLPRQQNVMLGSKGDGGKEFYSDDELISGNPTNKKSLFSQFGGLLFLLNKLEQEDVLKRLQQPQFSKRSMSWCLENFCWILLPQSKGDESVNVFSGRLFDKHQNDETAQAICQEEKQLLNDIAVEFKQKIVSSLSPPSRNGSVNSPMNGPENSADNSDLFTNLCRRKARIEAQPGWVNVFYELDSVDTTVRAAGLDLNPDYLPWLAYVVKFYYE